MFDQLGDLFTVDTAEHERFLADEWKKFCDMVAGCGSVGKYVSDNLLRRITVNAPVLLSFVLLCVLIHVATGWIDNMGRLLGVHDTWDTFRFPLQYTALLTQS